MQQLHRSKILQKKDTCHFLIEASFLVENLFTEGQQIDIPHTTWAIDLKKKAGKVK